MEAAKPLKLGVNMFTVLGLFEVAAARKGLKLEKPGEDVHSQPIKTYVLDQKLLAHLEKHKIVGHTRPDCHYDTYTLVDENPQQERQGWAPSNYWNFKAEGISHKFHMCISLGVTLRLNQRERGIVLLPFAFGTFLSPSDHLPNFRMFKALTDSDKDAPDVAKDIAKSDDECIVVSWTELGLGGIRSISGLFAEFAHGNGDVEKLARMAEEVFAPQPYPKHSHPLSELYIAETAQPDLLRAWQAQLKAYRTRLAVA